MGTRRQLQTHLASDLVLSNNRNPVSSIKIVPGISDHDIVLSTLNTRCRRKPSVKRKVYIRKKADSDRIRKELQTFIENINKSAEGKSVNERWEEFESTMRYIKDSCVPHKTTSTRHNLPCFTRTLR